MNYFYAAARNGEITSGIIEADTRASAEVMALSNAQSFHNLDSTPDDEIQGKLDGFECYEMPAPFSAAPELLESCRLAQLALERTIEKGWARYDGLRLSLAVSIAKANGDQREDDSEPFDHPVDAMDTDISDHPFSGKISAEDY